MDLIAAVLMETTDGGGDSVEVYRLNGQKVFGISCGSGIRVCGLQWKSDGTMLAIAGSDRTICLIDSFSSKIAHRLSLDFATSNLASSMPSSQTSRQSSSLPSSQSTTEFIPTTTSWTSHFADPSATRSNLASKPNLALDDLLALNADVPSLLKLSTDLPADLTAINIETSLPKLSILPATGADDDVFSTRTSLDTIFHTANTSTGAAPGSRGRSGVIDTLIIGASDGSIHIRIFDSFVIGRIDVTTALPRQFRQDKLSVLKIAGHPLLSTIIVLLQSKAKVHLFALKLRFIPTTASILPTLATKATQLQNLLRYMNQICTQLTAELKTAFDLPGRFLRNINETLAEHDPNATFATAVTTLVVTGECDPRLKEWLVDEVGERGLKRWEKAVSDCLELVRRLTGECLVPAIERSLVVLSRLDGLSKHTSLASRLGLDEKRLKELAESVKVLVIVAEELLKDVCVELKEFAAFMRFLKFEAEVQAMEEPSERAEEMREAQEHHEVRTVLEYIGGALQESRTRKYFGAGQVGHEQSPRDEGQFYTAFKAARKSAKKGWATPTVDEILWRMRAQADQVFAHIAETLRKSITVSYLSDLQDQGGFDVRFVPAKHGKPSFDVFMISKGKEHPHGVRIDALEAHYDGDVKYRGGHNVQVQESTDILDMGIADDNSYMCLAEVEGDAKIMTFPLCHADDVDAGVELAETHVFPGGMMVTGLKAANLAINGRRGRRSVAVTDEDGKSYVVMDIDGEVEREEETIP